MNTVSPFELLAIPVNLAGLVLAMVMMIKTGVRHRAVMRMPDYVPGGPRVIAAWRHYRCEAGRISFHIVAIVIGIWGLWYMDSGTWFAWFVMFSRILLGALFSVFSAYDMFSDHKLEGLIGTQSTVVEASLEARDILHAMGNDLGILFGNLTSVEHDGTLGLSGRMANKEAQERLDRIIRQYRQVQRLVQGQSEQFRPTREDGVQGPETPIRPSTQDGPENG